MPCSFITYKTRNNESFDGYLAAPDGKEQVPGIVLITAIFGVDEEMRLLSDEWAKDGFIVSTPDIFWRQTPGPTADMEVAFDRYGKFDPEQGLKDIEDLIKDLRSRPQCNGKVAVLGFCFGGRYAHLATTRLGANAAAAFHGTGIGLHLDEADKVTVPVSYHFGTQDPIVPMDEVNAIRSAFAGKPNAEIMIHEGVTHNFSMPQKDGYNPIAAKASREAVLRCFRSL